MEKKSTITDMKNSLKEFNSRFEQAEVRINELENRSVESMRSKEQKENAEK